MSKPFDFNPLDPVTRRDPFDIYARGRREQPFFEHHGLPVRVISAFRYADCQAVLRDVEAFSNDFNQGPLAERIPAEFKEAGPPSMIATDPPEHTRLRSLVNKAFTPRIVQRLEPRMREVAEELVGAAVDAGEVDLVQALTYPLPVTVIAEIIGIPPADRERFKRWSDELVSGLGLGFLAPPDAARIESRLGRLREMRSYFVPLAEERRRQPREDLLTGLVQAEHEGSRLSYDEMLSMLTLLLIAGNETTTTLIGNTVLELLLHPEAMREVREDATLLPGAIEEVLRFASPVQFDPRRATRDLELGDTKIAKHDVVFCWLASANRDERVFERPDVFDLRRDKSPHLAFGFGTHFCIGANLARLEARVAVETLLARTSRIERSGDEELPLHPSPVFRAVQRLPLRLRPR